MSRCLLCSGRCLNLLCDRCVGVVMGLSKVVMFYSFDLYVESHQSEASILESMVIFSFKYICSLRFTVISCTFIMTFLTDLF